MKKVMFMIGAAAMLLLASCKSSPKVEERVCNIYGGLQDNVEAILQRHLSEYDAMDGVVIVMETNSGRIRGMVGLECNFFQLLDAGMAFFLKHLNMSGKIVGFRREENMEVPAEALREALTNSLCHRQLEKYNLTPSIAIYDDRIEIENPGVLPPQLDTETIKQSHGSYPYNPIMAEVLYRTTFLESWGSGASRIIEACKAQNVPEPTWSINGGFICVTFVRPITDPMKTPVGLQLGLSSEQVGPKLDPSSYQVRTKFVPS